ncbi:MAG: M48 family metallopeptidase [Caulobacterales bacterium]
MLFRPNRHADGDVIDVAGAPVRLKVNARARRVSLRLDRTRREVVAVAPSQRRLPDAAAFALERSAWIAERLAELPGARPFVPGAHISLFGEPALLVPTLLRARLERLPSLRLAAPGEGDAYAMRIERLIRRHAVGWFSARCAVHCTALEVLLPSIAVMDAKGRWGSCRAAFAGRPAAIRLSWRLALAPPAVADYVAAHECAHLLEANHGPRFWAHVRRLVGEERPHRAWLRRQGAALHAMG